MLIVKSLICVVCNTLIVRIVIGIQILRPTLLRQDRTQLGNQGNGFSVPKLALAVSLRTKHISHLLAEPKIYAWTIVGYPTQDS